LAIFFSFVFVFFSSEIRYDCFLVNVNPLKLTIENQLRRLHDAILNYLKQSIVRDAATIDTFVTDGLVQLNDQPKTLDELGQSAKKHEELDKQRQALQPLYQQVEAKNRLLRSVAGRGHEHVYSLQDKLDRFDSMMSRYTQSIDEQRDQLKQNIQTRYDAFIGECEKTKLRWQQFRPHDQDMEDEKKCRDSLKLVRDKEKELEHMSKTKTQLV
jgi:hypothetical protein